MLLNFRRRHTIKNNYAPLCSRGRMFGSSRKVAYLRRHLKAMKSENLYPASKDLLTVVLSFFSRVDAKLSVVLAVDTGMLAVLGTNAPSLKNFSWLMIIFAAITLLLLAASIIFLYR